MPPHAEIRKRRASTLRPERMLVLGGRQPCWVRPAQRQARARVCGVRWTAWPPEVYLVLELGRLAGKPPATVIEIYKKNKGKGWGLWPRLSVSSRALPSSRRSRAPPFKRTRSSRPGRNSGQAMPRHGARPADLLKTATSLLPAKSPGKET